MYKTLLEYGNEYMFEFVRHAVFDPFLRTDDFVVNTLVSREY